MLNPNNDRLDYGEILAPPENHDLDFAVGTTYSLDLDALVGASLAMGLSQEMDSDLVKDPLFLLEALRATGDKVALFCQSGQIHVPNHVTSLYILLEKMVFPVKMPRETGSAAYPSFHPKFWLIRYQDKGGESLYRVIVLSRNLTFDRSWDITYYMDGKPMEQETKKNQPIIDFLRFLRTKLPSDENGRAKAKHINLLLKELPKVIFQLEEEEFSDYEFLPTGVRDSEGKIYTIKKTRLFTDTFDEMFIMSPFLSKSVLEDFNGRVDACAKNPKLTLITRKMSLRNLKTEDVSNFKIYVMKDHIIDGEMAISDDQTGIQKQDIHAKLYMMRKGSNTDLYLGSLNASHNAVCGNVEFMILLHSKDQYLDMDKLTDSLFGNKKDGSDNPFQEFLWEDVLNEEGDVESGFLDRAIKELDRCNPRAVVEQEPDGRFSVTVHFGDCGIDKAKVKIRVKPLLSNQSLDLRSDLTFSGLALDRLSEFYVVSASDGNQEIKRIFLIPTEGIPKDREKAVVKSVVKDEDCFYRYIMFLLEDDPVLGILDGNFAVGNGTAGSNRQGYQVPALYEKMLRTAATNPEKFRGIEYLMETVPEDGVIPEDFKKLYGTFKKAVKMDG